MTRVVLHIGMHKTASTYIQKRLDANQPLLKQHGIRFDDDSKNLLKHAARKNDFGPWNTRLQQARKWNADLLISSEVLSHLLTEPCNKRVGDCIGDWLIRQFQRRDCRIILVAFLRDQPGFLNSHYAQLVRNFSLRCSFETYAESVMQHRHARGECNPDYLFGWIQRYSSIKAHFVPYGGRSGDDPFQQLLQTFGVPTAANWRSIPPENSQAGRLAVATSIRVQERLEALGIQLSSKAARRQATHALLRRSRRYRWFRDRFNGLTPELYQRIREHYGAVNERFAQRVWGGSSWTALFPDDPPTTQKPLGTFKRWWVEWESQDLARQLASGNQR